MPVYLADTSIWVGRRRSGAEYLQQVFLERFGHGEIATCVPIALEVLVGAEDGRTYAQEWLTLWQHLIWLPLRERATGRALEIQSDLARVSDGAHRISPTSYLIAACAEDAGSDVVLWHWEDSLSVICRHTGQPHEPENERARDHGFMG